MDTDCKVSGLGFRQSQEVAFVALWVLYFLACFFGARPNIGRLQVNLRRCWPFFFSLSLWMCFALIFGVERLNAFTRVSLSSFPCGDGRRLCLCIVAFAFFQRDCHER